MFIIGGTYIRNGDGVEDVLGVQVPETEGVGTANTSAGLQDTDGLDKVRGEDELPLPVDGKTVRGELLAKNVEQAIDILGPLVDDVELRVGLDETAGGGPDSRTHVGDVETSIGLCADLVGNGREDGPVALLELGAVGVAGVEVESSVLVMLDMLRLHEYKDIPGSSAGTGDHLQSRFYHQGTVQDGEGRCHWRAHP